MIVCPAQSFDIHQIMNIERQSFIPAIQEKKRVFEKRLKIFPEGFLLLADCSDEVVLENPENLDKKSYKILEKRFSLGHNPVLTHKTEGSVLYVSSYALLKDYRGKGLGEKFFLNSLAALVSGLGGIKKVVLLVNEDWQAARKIYEKNGFKEKFTLKGFFPTLQKKKFADGIVMEADAENLKRMKLSFHLMKMR